MSKIFGWGYFFCWSLSFYPQIWENYHYRSVAGLSIEYALLNPAGYFFYSIYNVVGVIGGGKIGDTGTIDLNDLAFAVHGFAASSLVLAQCAIYDRGQIQEKAGRGAVLLLAIETIVILIVFVIECWGWRGIPRIEESG